jgi:molybdenum cofactor synthesis domain-containing protein
VDIVTEEQLEAESQLVKDHLIKLTDQIKAELIFVCGSTGPNPDDIVPGLIREISDKEITGIGEAMRMYGLERTPHAMISDQVSGIRNKSLLIALPGSSRGAEESMNALFPGLLHIFKVIRRG